MARPPLPMRILGALFPPSEAFRHGLNLYPPYLGAGVVCTEVAPDFTRAVVELRMHGWNRNYVGTHFGGNLYTMADPFHMLLLMRRLGPGFIVWDKAATIRFKRPGKGTVRAVFEITPDDEARIHAAFDDGARSIDEVWSVQIVDADGTVVAEVDKTIYVKKKPAKD